MRGYSRRRGVVSISSGQDSYRGGNSKSLEDKKEEETIGLLQESMAGF
jgi:hypothetical protein